ncbi:MAG: hypothetical protein KDD00_07125 [Ignavibacteriae bacterium]|nr:hypothetical protein [Ignavibacteriota bacterium]
MKKIILTLIVSITFINSSFSQDSVTVILHQPPPFQFNVSSLWNMTLINNTNESINVYLFGTASSHKTEIVNATTSGILLPPGTKNINASQFQTIDISYNSNSGNFSDIVQQTGSFPAGNYEYCVTVKRVDNNAELGSQCEDVAVENFSQVELSSPMNEAEVNDIYPIFSWLPPTPVPPGNRLNYILNVYEILSRQTDYDAVQSNPAFFQSPYIQNTVMRYPAVSRSFRNDMRYAIQVNAYIKVDTGYYLISQSDVKSFIYKNLTASLIDTMYGKTLNRNLNKPGSYRENDYYPTSGGNFLATKQKAIDYGVNTNIYFEAANKPGVYSELLKTFSRIDVVPNFALYGIPFGVNIFYATDNSSSRQNMNNFSFDFDPNDLKEMVKTKVEEKLSSMQDEIEKKIRDKGEQFRSGIEEQAKESAMNNLSFPLKLFSQFRNLGIGNNYPQYTDYTVSGVSVTGLNLEFNPGIFYMAFTGPLNNRAVDNTTFKRNLYSGRLGIGKYDDSHFYLTGLYAKDDYGSIYVDPNNVQLTPKSNQLFGAEGQLSLLKEKLVLKGEIAVSFLTDDTQAADVESESLPSWVKNMFDPKVSSRVDGFYKVGVSYDIDQTQTKIKANMKMVGPGYLSLGSPSKPNDLMEYEFSVDQKLLSNQLTGKISFKTGWDNLLTGYKTNTTYNSLLNFSINARFKNYPTLSINYYPVFLSNDASDPLAKLSTVNQNLTLVTSYPVKILKEQNNLSLLFSWNNSDNYQGLNNSYNWSLTMSDMIYFKSKLFLSASLGLLNGRGFDTLTTYNVNVSGGFTMLEVWQNALGFNVTSSPDKDQSLQIYFNSNATFLKYFTIDARLEKNIYDDYQFSGINDTNELIFKSTLSMNWK